MRCSSKIMVHPTSRRYVTATHTARWSTRCRLKEDGVPRVGIGCLPLPLPRSRGPTTEHTFLSPGNHGASDRLQTTRLPGQTVGVIAFSERGQQASSDYEAPTSHGT